MKKKKLNTTKGVKFDGGKPKYDLIPVYPLKVLAQVYTLGAEKYSEHNWRKGLSYSRILAAMNRHIEGFKGGEDLDPELTLHHIACVAFGCFSLIEFSITHPEYDDRYKKGVDYHGQIKSKR